MARLLANPFKRNEIHSNPIPEPKTDCETENGFRFKAPRTFNRGVLDTTYVEVCRWHCRAEMAEFFHLNLNVGACQCKNRRKEYSDTEIKESKQGYISGNTFCKGDRIELINPGFNNP